MEPRTGGERRKYQRLVTGLPSEVTLFDAVNLENLDRPWSIVTRDISAGGLAMRMDGLGKDTVNGLRTGAIKIYVDISLPLTSSPVRALAEVAWMKEEGENEGTLTGVFMGLSFVDINDWDRFNLDKYVTSALNKQK